MNSNPVFVLCLPAPLPLIFVEHQRVVARKGGRRIAEASEQPRSIKWSKPSVSENRPPVNCPMCHLEVTRLSEAIMNIAAQGKSPLSHQPAPRILKNW